MLTTYLLPTYYLLLDALNFYVSTPVDARCMYPLRPWETDHSAVAPGLRLLPMSHCYPVVESRLELVTQEPYSYSTDRL
jgi:hypothetical protein